MASETCEHSLTRKEGGVTLSQAVSKEGRLRDSEAGFSFSHGPRCPLSKFCPGPPGGGRSRRAHPVSGAESQALPGPQVRALGVPCHRRYPSPQRCCPRGGHSGGSGGRKNSVNGRALRTHEAAFCGALGICWQPLEAEVNSGHLNHGI